ncbi:hypothetical protein Nepgr_017204 [Nepenthes gracilis]|uniref:DNA/RNA-binding protein Alba-like domain-containing protein n=1 Tax=Nepenthes gracilis TaxID=150966 RepID=A0AAD3SP07_NEPGR|nr:hypothetical protein Nepgr_017204 [Nepenthes gracilis]
MLELVSIQEKSLKLPQSIFGVICIPFEKGSNEIVFKAMGRAINKTVMIVESSEGLLVFIRSYQLDQRQH